MKITTYHIYNLQIYLQRSMLIEFNLYRGEKADNKKRKIMRGRGREKCHPNHQQSADWGDGEQISDDLQAFRSLHYQITAQNL